MSLPSHPAISSLELIVQQQEKLQKEIVAIQAWLKRIQQQFSALPAGAADTPLVQGGFAALKSLQQQQLQLINVQQQSCRSLADLGAEITATQNAWLQKFQTSGSNAVAHGQQKTASPGAGSPAAATQSSSPQTIAQNQQKIGQSSAHSLQQQQAQQLPVSQSRISPVSLASATALPSSPQHSPVQGIPGRSSVRVHIESSPINPASRPPGNTSPVIGSPVKSMPIAALAAQGQRSSGTFNHTSLDDLLMGSTQATSSVSSTSSRPKPAAQSPLVDDIFGSFEDHTSPTAKAPTLQKQQQQQQHSDGFDDFLSTQPTSIADPPTAIKQIGRADVDQFFATSTAHPQSQSLDDLMSGPSEDSLIPLQEQQQVETASNGDLDDILGLGHQKQKSPAKSSDSLISFEKVTDPSRILKLFVDESNKTEQAPGSPGLAAKKSPSAASTNLLDDIF